MSVSPPCASPLERVQSTRARFVRAKPDPVLRFDWDYFLKKTPFWILWPTVINDRGDSNDFFGFPALSEYSPLFLPLKPNICLRWEILTFLWKMIKQIITPTFVKVGDYMHKVQRDLVPSHRKIVTDWMLEVGLHMWYRWTCFLLTLSFQSD